MSKMKVFGGAMFVRGHRQMRAVVACTSQKAAAAVTGQTLGEIRTYWCETGNAVEVELALSQPGVIFVGSLNSARTKADYQPLGAALQNPALERMARIDDELGEQP